MSNITEETINQALNKSFTQPAITGNVLDGLQGVNLDPSLLQVYPENTFFIKEIGRKEDGFSTTSSFKRIVNLNVEDVEFGLEEAGRGQRVRTDSETFTGKYAAVGIDGYVTYEAYYTAQKFIDVVSLEVSHTLARARVLEERTVLNGFATVQLATPSKPEVATATTGGNIASGQTVTVRCVALTFKAYNKVKPSIQLRVGRTTQLEKLTATVTYQTGDGISHTVNGGGSDASVASDAVTTGSGSKNSITASVAPVAGAAGYAWFVGAAGSERLVSVTSLNSVLITALPAVGSTLALASTFSLNKSTDDKVFDGIIAQIVKPGSGSYLKALDTGVAGVGSKLTSDGANGVKEIEEVLAWYMDNLNMSPDYMIVSNKVYNQIVSLVLGNGGNALVMLPQQNGNISINAGTNGIKFYNSKWTGKAIEIVRHPEAIEGSILFWKKTIDNSVGISNTLEISCRKNWYRQDWAMVNRSFQFGTYADEMLKCYFPPALAFLYNIAV